MIFAKAAIKTECDVVTQYVYLHLWWTWWWKGPLITFWSMRTSHGKSCWSSPHIVGFEVFTAVVMKSIIFWEWRHVFCWVSTNVSEEHITSIFMVEEIGSANQRASSRLHSVISQKLVLFPIYCWHNAFNFCHFFILFLFFCENCMAVKILSRIKT
jgi:hypothetical protein